MGLLLKDKVFISTRAKNQSGELLQLFTNAGATVIEMPLVKIQSARLADKEKKVFEQLHDFQWLIFTSTNGVRCFFEKLKEIKGNQVLPEPLQIAVIGSKTGEVLSTFGTDAHFINPGSTSEDFARHFVPKIKGRTKNPEVLLVVGNTSRTVILEQLRGIANCTCLNLYETKSPETMDERTIQLIAHDRYDMLLFASPSAVRNFTKLAKGIQPGKIRAACIGETTSKAAVENNILPLVVAKKSTVQGLYESILNYYKK
jgi:uroporphyrinogen-III synthase